MTASIDKLRKVLTLGANKAATDGERRTAAIRALELLDRIEDTSFTSVHPERIQLQRDLDQARHARELAPDLCGEAQREVTQLQAELEDLRAQQRSATLFPGNPEAVREALSHDPRAGDEITLTPGPGKVLVLKAGDCHLILQLSGAHRRAQQRWSRNQWSAACRKAKRFEVRTR